MVMHKNHKNFFWQHVLNKNINKVINEKIHKIIELKLEKIVSIR